MEEVIFNDFKKLLRESGTYCCIASRKFPELFLARITKSEIISSLRDAKAQTVKIIKAEKISSRQMIAICL
jgi:hypothetical protein